MSQYTEDDDLPNAVRFTKAERSLSLGVTGTNTDLDSVFRALQSPEENLRVIKFFGLSLGEADYPYLKQFFDKSHITDTDSGVNSFIPGILLHEGPGPGRTCPFDQFAPAKIQLRHRPQTNRRLDARITEYRQAGYRRIASRMRLIAK